jgi:phosphoesterase RecJ-like protein
VTQAPASLSPSLAQAAELVERASGIAVMAHVNPDADAIGSIVGLERGFCALGKRAVAALSDPVPDYARFLPGTEDIVSSLPSERDAIDLLVCVDSADIERLGSLYRHDVARFERTPILNIDHHRTNPLYGTVNLVDPAASSSSELAYYLLSELGTSLSQATATALLFGIVGDTGSFRNGATTPGSLDVAARLLRLGADNQRIAFHLFESKTFAAAKLWGLALSTMDLDRERGIVFAYLSQAMLQEGGVSPDETEGLPEYLRGIQEADVVMLLKETEDGEIRVSMRSRPRVDVAAIASACGGGGHRQAAGCTIPGPFSAAKRVLIAVFDQQVASSPPIHGAGQRSAVSDQPPSISTLQGVNAYPIPPLPEASHAHHELPGDS